MPVNNKGEFVPNAAAGIFGGCENCGCASCAGSSSGGECCDCRFIIQVPCGSAANAQALSLLATGIVKNTTGTGVLSIATVGVDYSAPITVEEEDGSPSVPAVTTIQFAESDGFSVSNPSPGVALINITSGGGSFNLTVEDDDGVPSFSAIDTIQFPSDKGFIVSNPSPGVAKIDLIDYRVTTIPFIVRNTNGDPLTDGIKGEITVDFDCVIEGVKLYADQTGDVSVDIEKTNFAGYPGSFSSIVAASPPVLSSGLKYTDTTLTGWTTSVIGGSVFRYTLSGTANITRLLIALKVRRV